MKERIASRKQAARSFSPHMSTEKAAARLNRTVRFMQTISCEPHTDLSHEAACEGMMLLTDILRSEWGFCGMVTTNWWNHASHYKEVTAGNDLKMARDSGNPEHTLQMILRLE